MDNLTHSLAGALIGQAGLKRKTGLALPALIIGANLPDVDAACLFWLDGVQHLAFRRGITHGPIAWILLPLLLASALYWFDRWQARRGKRPEGRLAAHFGWLYLLAFIACLTHPALDWLNSYGIRLLEPFSSRWFYGDILFIIDVWLWLGMGFATGVSLWREKRGRAWRRPAQAALGVVLLYIAVNSVISISAENRFRNRFMGATSAQVVVIASPVPFKFWEREVLLGDRLGWSEYFDLPGAHNEIVTLGTPACNLRSAILGAARTDQLKAFLFWSRAPFAERAADGSVLIRDARYYDPLARDRFTVALPNVRCEPVIR